MHPKTKQNKTNTEKQTHKNTKTKQKNILKIVQYDMEK